jgi:hypothetical protein
MTPIEKSERLVNSMYLNIRRLQPESTGHWEIAKECAATTVTEIMSELEDYGKKTDELQNMDRDFNYWGFVKFEVFQIEIWPQGGLAPQD